MIILQECLQEVFQQFGWSRIPEVLHAYAEEAAKHITRTWSFSTSCCKKRLLPSMNALFS